MGVVNTGSCARCHRQSVLVSGGLCQRCEADAVAKPAKWIFVDEQDYAALKAQVARGWTGLAACFGMMALLLWGIGQLKWQLMQRDMPQSFETRDAQLAIERKIIEYRLANEDRRKHEIAQAEADDNPRVVAAQAAFAVPVQQAFDTAWPILSRRSRQAVQVQRSGFHPTSPPPPIPPGGPRR